MLQRRTDGAERASAHARPKAIMTIGRLSVSSRPLQTSIAPAACENELPESWWNVSNRNVSNHIHPDHHRFRLYGNPVQGSGGLKQLVLGPKSCSRCSRLIFYWEFPIW